jgi:hypothetical protein
MRVWARPDRSVPERSEPTTTLNGTPALVERDGETKRVTVLLPEQHVAIEIDFTTGPEQQLAEQIVQTVGATATPIPVPPLVAITPGTTPAATTPATTPVATDYCTAVESVRALAGTTTDQLPYYERIRDAAPAEIRAPIETQIAWLQDGSPTPLPADVSAAQLQMTRDWISRCQSSPTTNAPPPILQVLNASGVQGSATALTNEIRSKSGWMTVPPNNAPVNRTGSAVQCRSGGIETDVLVAQLLSLLSSLGVSARSEPVPNPLPPAYDQGASCYVILGK